MSEQQYRVVADMTSMADDSWITEGDRVTYGSVSSTGELVIFRIERPVSTTCMCGPQSVISDGPNTECPVHGARPHLPTREQIAEVLWSSAAEDGDDPRWTWAYLTERADRSEGDYSEIRAEYYSTADAVLALFQNGAGR